MRTSSGSNWSTLLMTFVAGGAVGALVVALTTRKTGAELRGDLKAYGNRLRGKGGKPAVDLEETWDELQIRATRTAEELKTTVLDGAKELRS
jgi:gas vesicle protein